MGVDRSDVVSFVALFVALGGSGIAAVGEFRRGSVTTSALKNGAVIETKIGDGAVSRRALHPGAVTSQHLATDAVTHRAIEPGGVWWDNLSDEVRGFVSAGARPGAARVIVRAGTPKLVSGGPSTTEFLCQPGEVAVAGGFTVPANTSVTGSYQGDSNRTWVLKFSTIGTAGEGARGYVTCFN